LDKSITYVGLDVHKDTIAVALAEAGVRGDVREYGKVANTPAAVRALATKLSRVGSALRFCYEAGPCGFGIQRQLTLAGHECVVVAPSLIPRKPGDRIKILVIAESVDHFDRRFVVGFEQEVAKSKHHADAVRRGER
jgi:transposase